MKWLLCSHLIRQKHLKTYQLGQNEPTPTLASSPSWIELFSVLEFDVKCFFMCVAHQVGPPLSFGIWVDLLHLCLTFKSNGDPPFALFWWWGTNYVTWCCLGWFSPPSVETQGFIFCMSKHMFFCHSSFSFLVGKLTSCYCLMESTPWLMLPLLISPKQIYFHVLFHIARWPQQWQQVKQRKDSITIGTWWMRFFPWP